MVAICGIASAELKRLDGYTDVKEPIHPPPCEYERGKCYPFPQKKTESLGESTS